VHPFKEFVRYVLHDPSAYAVLALVLILVVMAYVVPLFCWLARFLGWPWRRRARS
jgi:hypothetical protein